jgi:hypothetical protein
VELVILMKRHTPKKKKKIKNQKKKIKNDPKGLEKYFLES